MKNATAISHGSKRLLVSVKGGSAPEVEDVGGAEGLEEETDTDEAFAGASLLRSTEFEELGFGGLEGIVVRDSRSLPGFFSDAAA
jgi:hypothetical protein